MLGTRSFRPDPLPSVPSLDPNALPSNTGRLLDFYFAYTHCWFPVIEKHDALRVSYSTSSTVANNSGDVAALWAILAHSSLQEQPPALRDSSQSQAEDAYLTPTLLYETARTLIPKDTANFEPGHVQALLLLAMVNLGSGLWVSASVLAGQAVRITLSAPDDWARSASNKYKKLLAGCFIVDTLISARLGSLPHLRTADLKTNLVPEISNFDESGSEEWDPWTEHSTLADDRARTTTHHRVPLRIMSTFNQFFQIISILNDTICDPTNSLMAAGIFAERSAALNEWYMKLPSHCSIPKYVEAIDLYLHRGVLPHVLHLHLTYESTAALLRHRQTVLNPLYPSRLVTCESSWPIMELLKTYLEVFGAAATPASFDFFSNVARVTSFEENPNAHDPIRNKYSEILNQMGSVWPAFKVNRPLRYPRTVPSLTSGLRESSIDTVHDVHGIDYPWEFRRITDTDRHGEGVSHYTTSYSTEPNAISPMSDRRSRDVATKDLDDLDLSNLIASPSQAMHIENPQQLLPMASIPTQYGETNQLSASIFDYPDNGDAATATEAILEELAATNGVEWSAISSQFMYDLGYSKEDTSFSIT